MFSSKRDVHCSSWWSKDTVAVVTGANRGIGYEIVRALAEQGLTVVLTARSQASGQAAVNALKTAGLKSMWFYELDVASVESAQNLATWLKQQFGGIDILEGLYVHANPSMQNDSHPGQNSWLTTFHMNNAGINKGSGCGDIYALSYKNAKQIIDTNYYGVKKVTEALLLVLRSSPAGARIVNSSSRARLVKHLKSESLKQTLRDAGNYSTELADSLATKYLADMKVGRKDEEGWIPARPASVPTYGKSKMILNIYAIALAKSLAKSQPENHQILATNFCPGPTKTDMYNIGIEKQGISLPPGTKVKTVAEGAETGVWLALLPKEELVDKVGRFYGEMTEFSFACENPPSKMSSRTVQ